MLTKDHIVKFRQEFVESERIEMPNLNELNAWRNILYNQKLIGENNGVGYGNMSQLLPPFDAQKNKKRFIITGSQTGGFKYLSKEHYALVLEYDSRLNFVGIQKGPIMASSEAMTHGALYDLDNDTRFVFHAHSPEIWNNARKLSIPLTKKDVKYGTPEMIEEIKRLFSNTNVKDLSIFATEGHEEGIFTFGRTATQAGCTMLYYLVESRSCL